MFSNGSIKIHAISILNQLHMEHLGIDKQEEPAQSMSNAQA